ncbi:MAG: hypothetical protein V3575_02775 [Candidatus Absconditabacteria bacterium]
MKKLQEIMNETSNAKLLSVFSKIPLTCVFSKDLISTLSLGKESTEKDIETIKNNIINFTNKIDFKDINNIKKNIPLLLIFYNNQQNNKYELKKYIENKGIDIIELSGDDLIVFNYIGFVLVDYGFLDPDLIFNNNIDDLIDIYIEIEKNTKKIYHEDIGHGMLFGLYSLIEYLILVYENQGKFFKIMKKEPNIKNTKTRFKNMFGNSLSF